MNLKLEVIAIPVSDIDRAKKFYQEALGCRLDADLDIDGYAKLLGFKPPFPPDFRAVQLTPPGSQCSIHLARGKAKPGSAQGMYLITDDMQATCAELARRGVEVTEPYHFTTSGPTPGVHPEHQSYNSYASFKDPDGNEWLIQEIQQRLPGRVTQSTSEQSMDVPAVADLLHETSQHHGHFEETHAKHNWWDWYAAYFSARQNGSSSEEATSSADRYMKEVFKI